MKVKVEQARWNSDLNDWNHPGDVLEIKESDFPHYAAHCSILQSSAVAVDLEAPGESITENLASSAPADIKPEKKPDKKKGRK